MYDDNHVTSRSIIITAICIGVTVASPSVEARGFFRHLAGKMIAGGAEAGVVGYGVAEIGATVVLARAMESIEVSSGGMSQAVVDVRTFLIKHRLAGNSEMAHAMKKEVEDHPDRLQVMQNLASQSGVKVDLTKVKRLEPPGRCSEDEYEGLRRAKEIACNGVNGEGSPVRSCKSDMPGKSKEEKINIWKGYIDIAKECREARKNIMKECFDDGDEGHQIAVKQLNAIIRRCNGKVGYKNEPEDLEYEEVKRAQGR